MKYLAEQLQGQAKAEDNGQFVVVSEWENNSREIVIKGMSSLAAAKVAAEILNDDSRIGAGTQFKTKDGKSGEVEARRGDVVRVKVWNAPRQIARSIQSLAWVARQIGETEAPIQMAVERALAVSNALYSIDALPDQAMRLAASITGIQAQGGDLAPALDAIAYLRYVLNGIPGIYAVDPKNETVNNWLRGI